MRRNTYNVAGQRVQKTGITTSLFMYDESGQLLGEYNSAGSALYEIIYLDEQPVAVFKPVRQRVHLHPASLDQVTDVLLT